MSSIPKWDGKVARYVRYLAQVNVLAKYYDCGDAMACQRQMNYSHSSLFLSHRVMLVQLRMRVVETVGLSMNLHQFLCH